MKWRYCYLSACSAEALQAVYNTLSPSRKTHVDRMALEEDRARSLAGELLARQLLQAEFALSDPVLHRADSGRPYLSGDPVYVSISHCEDLIVCAADTKPLGIDTEKPRPIQPEMLQLVCTPEEAAYVREDPARFWEIWTGKEAWFKKLGTGITDLRSVNILPLPRQVFRIGEYFVQIL